MPREPTEKDLSALSYVLGMMIRKVLLKDLSETSVVPR